MTYSLRCPDQELAPCQRGYFTSSTALLSTTSLHQRPQATASDMGSPSGESSSSSPGNNSGSGSGSSSGGSGETARPNASQPSESITFTFSSRKSPFVNLSPPGSMSFVSNKRRGSESSRDRSYRRQHAPQVPFGPGWITLSPLKPMTDEVPLFDTPSSESSPRAPGKDTSTAVFLSRTDPSARQCPRLSLVAQHHHATSLHPCFNSPPQLVTPPPQDPFSQLKRPGFDGYFPLMPPKAGKSTTSHKKSTRSHCTKLEQPQPTHPVPRTSSSRTPRNPLESSTSHSTPRVLSRADPGPPTKASVLIPDARKSSTSTPTQRQTQPRKSVTPPRSQPLSQLPAQSPPPRPSIDAFRDCFGTLAPVENVFPTRTCTRGGSRAASGGSENAMGSGLGLNEFQRRWTKRWIRRTIRGVGSMGSGSTSSGSGTGLSRRGGGEGSSTVADTMIYLGLADGQGTSGSAGSGSQDSLDRVRVSRSNAPSPGMSSASSGSVGAAAATKSLGGGKSANDAKMGSSGLADLPQSVQIAVA
jgi:hypothetical protein